MLALIIYWQYSPNPLQLKEVIMFTDVINTILKQIREKKSP